MQQTVFHNTIGLMGNDLLEAVKKAKKQEEQILTIYRTLREKFSASDIHGMLEKAGNTNPLTSTRRGITNLLNSKDLIKHSEVKTGIYGSPEHFYSLNANKHPSKAQYDQANLFQ